MCDFHQRDRCLRAAWARQGLTTPSCVRDGSDTLVSLPRLKPMARVLQTQTGGPLPARIWHSRENGLNYTAPKQRLKAWRWLRTSSESIAMKMDCALLSFLPQKKQKTKTSHVVHWHLKTRVSTFRFPCSLLCFVTILLFPNCSGDQISKY